MSRHNTLPGATLWLAPLVTVLALPFAPRGLAAQVDSARAQAYFEEARALCEREAGRLWGVSLCGPLVFADPATQTIATSAPAPDAPRPRALGYANAAMNWGDERWAAFSWPAIPHDDPARRRRMLLHELFHVIQPGLGLFVATIPGEPTHLETVDGRYWLQLEWRALERALGESGVERMDALRDALAFRQARRTAFPDGAEAERVAEINEGLAQYTATAASAPSPDDAIADAAAQLREAPASQSLVRTFAYPNGAAYGVLLDRFAPGWTRHVTKDDDLAALLAAAAGLEPASDPAHAAERYGGSELRQAEEARAEAHRRRVAELRARFVDGPVLVVPRGRNASFVTAGVTPIPGVGTVYPQFRVSGEWGSLRAEQVLVSPDGQWLTLPEPHVAEGAALRGSTWTVELAPGWAVEAGDRPGDHRVVPAG